MLELDDGQFVHNIDKSNALAVVTGQAAQVKQEYDLKADLTGARNVVVAGMGGSALAAELVKNWLGSRISVPFVVCRDYDLPGFVSSNTLVVLSSYSGNTEETLSAYQQAKEKSAKMVVMTAGGKLKGLAETDGLPVLNIPTGFQPRMTTLFGVKALVTVLEHAGLVTHASPELAEAAQWAGGTAAHWVQEVPTEQNEAKKIARELHGHAAVVYAGPTLAFAAMKWKIDFNENAKNLAFYNYLPEFNHNEFQGWLNPNQTFKVIQLQSVVDSPRIAKRFEVSNRLLAKRFTPIVVKAQGSNKIQQLIWCLMLGGMVSVYLAVLNKVDPTPVELVEQLKKELG